MMKSGTLISVIYIKKIKWKPQLILIYLWKLSQIICEEISEMLVLRKMMCRWYFIYNLYSDCVSYFEPRRSTAARVQICNVQHQLTKFERWALSKFRVQNQTDLFMPSAMMMNYGNSVEAAGVSTSRLFSGGDSLGDVRVVVYHWLPYMIFSWQVLRIFCHTY